MIPVAVKRRVIEADARIIRLEADALERMTAAILLLDAVGRFAARAGETWRISEGAEIMDAYERLLELADAGMR